MPHLVQLDHDGAALGLGLLGVHVGEALDPSLHRGRRDAEQLGGAVHRQPAQVQQHRLDLDPQRHATGRRVGEVQPAGLAPVALLAAHEPVLDVLPAPAPLAPQRHPLTPSAVPLPTHMGDLCGLETLQATIALFLATWTVMVAGYLAAMQRGWTFDRNALVANLTVWVAVSAVSASFLASGLPLAAWILRGDIAVPADVRIPLIAALAPLWAALSRLLCSNLFAAFQRSDVSTQR